MWDALAKVCGQPLYGLWGGEWRTRIELAAYLLQKDPAKLVEDAADVLDELGVAARGVDVTSAPSALEPDAAKVLAALGHDPCDFDTLAARAGIEVESLLAILGKLELHARIVRTDAGEYQRLD